MASSSVSRTCAWLCMACWQQTWPGRGDCHSGAFTTRAPDTALTVTLLLRAEADGMALCPPGRCGGRRRRLVRQSTSPSAPSRKLHRHMQRMTVRASITSRIHPDLQRMTPSACAFRNLVHNLTSLCSAGPGTHLSIVTSRHRVVCQLTGPVFCVLTCESDAAFHVHSFLLPPPLASRLRICWTGLAARSPNLRHALRGAERSHLLQDCCQ